MEEQQTHITVDGTPYVLPPLDTLTIREGKTLKRQSGMTLDQVFELEGLDAGVIGGLLAIAIQRSDAAITDRAVDEMVDGVNLFGVMEELAASADEMLDPTQGGQPPVESDSQTSSEKSTISSGSDGSDGSEHSPETSNPPSTGVLLSETLAISDPETSVL